MPTTPHTLPHTRPETRQDSLWQAGWYRFAKRVDSPHFGARPEGTQIDLIVLHSISLPPGVYGGPHVVNFLSGQGLDDTHPYFKEIESIIRAELSLRSAMLPMHRDLFDIIDGTEPARR